MRKNRQANDKIAAMSKTFAQYVHTASMKFDETTDQRQTDAETALRAVERPVALHKHFE